MKTLIFVCAFFMFSEKCLAEYYERTDYYCKNMNPQHYVEINQLEGIWYVIEKIIHTEERHYKINMTWCPVIHISEDRSQSATYSPSYKTYETYGSSYPYDMNPTDPRNPYSTEQQYIKGREEYDRRTTYDYQRRKGSHTTYTKHLFTTKNLRIYWDDGNLSTEYHVRYDIREPGFWLSSGPGEGRIPEDPKPFAGTIQVIKAVGSHLALTFCHSLSENNKIFTVILSREKQLDKTDIHSVHNLLQGQGLSTRAIETCEAPVNGLSLALVVLVFGFYVINFVK